MKVQKTDSSPNFGKLPDIQGFLVDKFPRINLESERSKKVLDFIATNISSPEQRLVLGLTALSTQPMIDYYNKKIDEDTRYVSVARTIAKIIAGTVVGVGVRMGCIRFAKKYGQIDKAKVFVEDGLKYFKPKNGHFLAPKRVLAEAKSPTDKIFTQERLDGYHNAVGTLVGLVAMLFTNFMIDAPLTQYLTAIFTKQIEKPHKGGEK